MEHCVFCNDFLMKNKKMLFENELTVAYFDEFPVSKGHVLIITKRHAKTFFDITQEEQHAMFELLKKSKQYIDKKYKPTGYNIGFNCGEDAGQSVMHVHLHLIPRYHGDVENPRGGIRGVIPAKKNY
jgi:diadenosine tetraphosphate (Ap4A) HIT family hydrolase